MLRTSIVVGFFVLLGGCIPCESQVTDSALAPRPDFDNAIDSCVTKHACVLLCRDLFQLDPSVQIESCQVTKMTATNANVIVRYYDASTCTSGGDGVDIGLDDWSDGGGDDGSSDGSDTGSDGSDTGSDSGSDTGSDTSGTPRAAPVHASLHGTTVAR